MPGFCWGSKKSGVVSVMGLASALQLPRAEAETGGCATARSPSVSCRFFEGKLYLLLVTPKNVLPMCYLMVPRRPYILEPC